MPMETSFNGKHLLMRLSDTPGGAGDERLIAEVLEEELSPFVDSIEIDAVGNAVLFKQGLGAQLHPRIMLAAHMDEISLIVMKIDQGGFLRVAQIGGFDPRTLLGQEVIVHGKRRIKGVIGSKPPHLSSAEERKQTVPLTELFVDVGLPEQRVRELIVVGDRMTIDRHPVELLGGRISGKAMDNRASVAAVAICLEQLHKLRAISDVYAVGTVQEEIGSIGAQTAAFRLQPDLAIAIDVCHGETPGVADDLVQQIGKGPVITFGPHIHPKIFERLKQVAITNRIPYQIEVSQGATWTDADPIQITQAGVPTGLISIPLRYMHTAVETLSFDDVQNAGILLASFIADIDQAFVEDLICY